MHWVIVTSPSTTRDSAGPIHGVTLESGVTVGTATPVPQEVTGEKAGRHGAERWGLGQDEVLETLKVVG